MKMVAAPMGDMWSTNVGELMEVFRGASLALVPWLDKARIAWKEHEAYDDWDNIVAALYENIVCAPLFGDVAAEYDMARYDFRYDDYAAISHIRVRMGGQEDADMAFISFPGIVRPMDMVKVAILDTHGRVTGTRMLEHQDLEYFFVQRRDDGSTNIVDRLEVML